MQHLRYRWIVTILQFSTTYKGIGFLVSWFALASIIQVAGFGGTWCTKQIQKKNIVDVSIMLFFSATHAFTGSLLASVSTIRFKGVGVLRFSKICALTEEIPLLTFVIVSFRLRSGEHRLRRDKLIKCAMQKLFVDVFLSKFAIWQIVYDFNGVVSVNTYK